MSAQVERMRLYRIGQRVSVFDGATKRWREGCVIKATVGCCTVAESGGSLAWHTVPTTLRWIRPICIVRDEAAA
jgi:hypothetical protein